MLTALVVAFALCLSGVLAAAIDVSVTDCVKEVNPRKRVMNQEAGNYSIAQTNSDPGMIAWDFEPPEFTPGEQLGSIICSSVAKRIWFEPVSPYGPIISYAPDLATSGDHVLAYNSKNSAEAVFRLTDYYGETPILGVGFAVSRLAGEMPVSVYDETGNLLGSDTIFANGEGFSWFGYRGDTDIAKIVLDTSGDWSGSRFYIDDFAVTTTPDPATISLLGLGILGLLRRNG